MKIKIVKSLNQKTKKDYLVLPFLFEKKEPKALFNISKFKKYISGPISSKDFSGKSKEMSLVYAPLSQDKRIILLGLGEMDKMDEFQIAESYAEIVKFVKSKKGSSINILIPEKLNLAKEDLIKGIVEGLYLSNYSFDKFRHFTKKDLPSSIKDVCLIGLETKDMAIVKKGEVIADGVNLTRDLVNNNADDETPQHLAKVAEDFSKISTKIKVTVFDKKRIEKENMGLLLAVNKGSDKDPVFIIVEYKGNPSSKDTSVIVGKGITYDTGGLSLKPSTSMDTMKSDMSGGAAVLGAMYAIANLDLKVNVTCIVPATENAIGPKSYKPGDVYVNMANKSVEVKNTDAEGRLILAEGLSYAAMKIKPSRIIDLASLTGACVVALGEDVAAVFSNRKELAEAFIEASKRTGDHLWQMPLYQKYKEQLKSDIADLKNIGSGREAGTITAALFLQEFVDDIPWVHIDIAGPAFLSKPKGLHPTQASGMGVRLLTYFFENLAEKQKI
ncbi:MAG: leucyl aminopeptidase [Parachlamydiales bacterium]|nr:leucyl aminopeptidase [Parachlamydiales bacterium]